MADDCFKAELNREFCMHEQLSEAWGAGRITMVSSGGGRHFKNISNAVRKRVQQAIQFMTGLKPFFASMAEQRETVLELSVPTYRARPHVCLGC